MIGISISIANSILTEPAYILMDKLCRPLDKNKINSVSY